MEPHSESLEIYLLSFIPILAEAPRGQQIRRLTPHLTPDSTIKLAYPCTSYHRRHCSIAHGYVAKLDQSIVLSHQINRLRRPTAMPPAVSRFGPQILNGPFSQLQQSHLQHHSSQHQIPGAAGLPPPSFNAHPGFAQGNPNSNINLFAPTNGVNNLGAAFGGGGGGLGGGGGGTGLASHAAITGFAHGAAIQQQQAREALRRSSTSNKGLKSRIRDVWRGNLAQEIQLLRTLVEKYPYISMVSRGIECDSPSLRSYVG